jgi:hypothetical protein
MQSDTSLSKMRWRHEFKAASSALRRSLLVAHQRTQGSHKAR